MQTNRIRSGRALSLQWDLAVQLFVLHQGGWMEQEAPQHGVWDLGLQESSQLHTRTKEACDEQEKGCFL